MNTVHNKIMKLSVLTQLQQLLMMLMMMAAVVSCQNVFDPAVPDDHYFRYALHCMDQLQAQSGHEMREDFGRQMNGIVQQIQFELKQAVYSTNASISSIVSRLDAVESMCRTVNEKITRFESLIEPKATEESQQTTGR
jgi:hypothetical protein